MPAYSAVEGLPTRCKLSCGDLATLYKSLSGFIFQTLSLRDLHTGVNRWYTYTWTISVPIHIPSDMRRLAVIPGQVLGVDVDNT